MTIAQYIESVVKRHRLGNATEHTFRGDLQQLIDDLPYIRATNEPQRQVCSILDYILTKYTPQPVVDFIVRAVDDILKTEFGLPQGLADNSKTKIKIEKQGKQVEEEVHKVQILDPATGTGTFGVEVVKHIDKKFDGQEGIWSHDVENHLLTRLNGFELLMTSYTMAHLQLDLLLTETGYKARAKQRLRVYLTNSLEESHPETGTLLANWLSAEANEAKRIKRDAPVMCVVGNPPYSGESQNRGQWIMNLMEDYKKEPGGKEKRNEKKTKWINDDSVKFLRCQRAANRLEFYIGGYQPAPKAADLNLMIFYTTKKSLWPWQKPAD